MKAGLDQFRDDQRTFLNEIKAAHVLAFVVHSPAEFQHTFGLRRLAIPYGRCTHDRFACFALCRRDH